MFSSFSIIRLKVKKILAVVKIYNNRYQKNFSSLSLSDTELLHLKRACVIGCGGLGGYIVESLARIGIRYITVVDHDVFDETNLNRQRFSTENVIGKPKVSVCKEKIAEINSEVTIKALKCKFEECNGMDIIKGHDVVLDGLDDIKTRLLLAKSCNESKIPMVHGSIGGWYGQVATILPGDITMDILFGNTDDRGIEVELGNLPFSASTVASIQCAEAVKLLTGKGTLLSKAFMRIDLLNNDMTIIELSSCIQQVAGILNDENFN